MHEVRNSDWASDAESAPIAWAVDRNLRLYGMRVVLLKRTFVLPWTQFLYAEGTHSEVRALFSLHTVIIRGAGLDSLMSDLASQVVAELRHPTRVDRFERATAAAGARVISVDVLRIDEKA